MFSSRATVLSEHGISFKIVPVDYDLFPNSYFSSESRRSNRTIFNKCLYHICLALGSNQPGF